VQIAGRKEKHHQSALPPAPTPARIETGIGHKLLTMMGWKDGQGIGKNREGILDPLAVTLSDFSQTNRKGLGSTFLCHYNKSK